MWETLSNANVKNTRVGREKKSKNLSWYVVITLSLLFTIGITFLQARINEVGGEEISYTVITDKLTLVGLNPSIIYGSVMGGIFTGIHLTKKHVILTILSIIHMLVPTVLFFS